MSDAGTDTAAATPAPAPAPAAPKEETAGEKRVAAPSTRPQKRTRPMKNYWPANEPPRVWGAPNENAGPHAKKYRVALLVGYLGEGYCGLQINGFECPTIERDLERALVDAGAISPENAHALHKVRWSRCARTDKGVSAAANVIGLNVILDPPVPTAPKDEAAKEKKEDEEKTTTEDKKEEDEKKEETCAEEEKKEEEKKKETPEEIEAREERLAQAMTAKINTFLPAAIRLYGMKKTTGGFEARTRCDGRVYQYILPAFCLCAATRDDATGELRVAAGPDLELVRAAAAHYVGSHNFHNFTVRKQPWEKTCMRHMYRVEVSDVHAADGLPVVAITVFGQSFMLHQIRKMVAFLIILCRAGAQRAWLPRLFEEVYERDKVLIPLAPALGLFLDHPCFTGYNKRFTDPIVPRRGPPPPRVLPSGRPEFRRGPLVADDWRPAIEAFKRDVLVPHIVATERRDHVAQRWMDVLDRRMRLGFVRVTSERLVTPALPPEEYTPEERAELREDGVEGEGEGDDSAAPQGEGEGGDAQQAPADDE